MTIGGVFLIDTIRIESPVLSYDLIKEIEKNMIVRMALDMSTGEQLYKFTSTTLEGSYDHRISLKINDNKLIIEGSVHKNLLGQNAIGMVEDFSVCASWFVRVVSEFLDVVLPSWGDWIPRRIDFAKCFDLESSSNIKKYLRGLTTLSFPRRKILKYGDTGVYVSGSTTTLKLYDKGEEFRKHDLKRFKKFYDENGILFFLQVVDRLLRVEVEIKYRKIKGYYGNNVKCKDIEVTFLRLVYQDEVKKLIKEDNHTMKLARTTNSVKDRLDKFYSKRLASILFGTWYMLSTLGETQTKEILELRTYYRHLKQLKDAGISWNNTDLIVEDIEQVDNIINFTPTLDSKFMINTIHEDCIKLYRDLYIA